MWWWMKMTRDQNFFFTIVCCQLLHYLAVYSQSNWDLQRCHGVCCLIAEFLILWRSSDRLKDGFNSFSKISALPLCILRLTAALGYLLLLSEYLVNTGRLIMYATYAGQAIAGQAVVSQASRDPSSIFFFFFLSWTMLNIPRLSFVIVFEFYYEHSMCQAVVL